MIRHLFSDMDGTILDATGRVTAATAAAVRQRGLPLTLVSARAPVEMAAAMTALGLTGPQVAFNGALIFTPTATGYHPLAARPLPAAAARAVIELVTQQFPAVSVSVYDDQRWLATRFDEGVTHEAAITGVQPQLVADLTAELGDPVSVFKVMLITFDEALLTRVLAEIQTLALPGIVATRSVTGYIEVTAAGADKSAGVAAIMASARVAATDAVAFGDGHNDLPMFRLVSWPIAMGNAAPEVKKAARLVTKANTADGVAYALQHLLP